jgi:arylsulfatase
LTFTFASRSARKEFIYFNDDGDLVNFRYENWKVVFEEQRVPGTMRIWAEPFTKLRMPKVFDLRSDPYERADITSNSYYDWINQKRRGHIHRFATDCRAVLGEL